MGSAMDRQPKELKVRVVCLTISFSDGYGIHTDFLYKARSTQNFKY